MPEQNFEALVPPEKMPPCPLCGKPILKGQLPMAFIAHGMVALAHDDCRMMKHSEAA
jgi:hypothetical protein